MRSKPLWCPARFVLDLERLIHLQMSEGVTALVPGQLVHGHFTEPPGAADTLRAKELWSRAEVESSWALRACEGSKVLGSEGSKGSGSSPTNIGTGWRESQGIEFYTASGLTRTFGKNFPRSPTLKPPLIGYKAATLKAVHVPTQNH